MTKLDKNAHSTFVKSANRNAQIGINMKEKLIRFMQGRYGADALSKFLMIIAMALIILSIFVRNSILTPLSLIIIFYGYFRIFSRNIPKRYAENQLYLKYRTLVLAKFHGLKTEMKQRKTHHIYRCPKCHQKLRVPKGRGKIAIRCSKCNTEFIKKS